MEHGREPARGDRVVFLFSGPVCNKNKNTPKEPQEVEVFVVFGVYEGIVSLKVGLEVLKPELTDDTKRTYTTDGTVIYASIDPSGTTPM